MSGVEDADADRAAGPRPEIEDPVVFQGRAEVGLRGRRALPGSVDGDRAPMQGFAREGALVVGRLRAACQVKVGWRAIATTMTAALPPMATRVAAASTMRCNSRALTPL